MSKETSVKPLLCDQEVWDRYLESNDKPNHMDKMSEEDYKNSSMNGHYLKDGSDELTAIQLRNAQIQRLKLDIILEELISYRAAGVFTSQAWSAHEARVAKRTLDLLQTTLTS